MRDLGYVEGQNLVIEYRDAEGDIDRLPGLAADLVALRVEIIVAANDLTAQAASRATSTIPIVATGADVVAAGLVTNIAHPEGNMTGVTTNSVETIGKWVELLTETMPTISRLAVMLDLEGPGRPGVRPADGSTPPSPCSSSSTVYDLRDLDQLSAVLATAESRRRGRPGGGVGRGGGWRQRSTNRR